MFSQFEHRRGVMTVERNREMLDVLLGMETSLQSFRKLR